MHVPADLADTNLDVVAYIPRLLTQTFRGAERRVLAQFAKIRDGEFDDRTFAALKQGLLAAETAQVGAQRGPRPRHGPRVRRPRRLGRPPALPPALRAVTRADVQRVANREYFGEHRLILRSRVGFPKKTRLDKPRYPPVTPTAATRNSSPTSAPSRSPPRASNSSTLKFASPPRGCARASH
jgi:zinc protease